MESFLLKISQCHLLTDLGRLAQLPLQQASQVYGESSGEVVSKLVNLGLLSAGCTHLVGSVHVLSTQQLGKEAEKLLGVLRERVQNPLSRCAQTQCREIC